MITELPFKQYRTLALTTKAPSETLKEDLEHAGYGLLTEIGEVVDIYKKKRFYKREVDKVHLLEELGDLMWYVAIADFALGGVLNDGVVTPYILSYEDMRKDDPKSWEDLISDQKFIEQRLAKLSHFAVNLFTVPLRHDDVGSVASLSYDLTRLMDEITLFCMAVGIDFEQVKVKNIQKLAKRYPEGFTEFNAINRDTDAERKELEQ